MHVHKRHGLPQQVVADRQLAPQHQYIRTQPPRVVPVAPPRVALLVHYFQRPTNELPVPIARAREASPLPQRLPLLLREQSVLLQEGVEHL